uniref:THAP domain-containing protein 1 n=1 Tax=Oryzias melastigma TaxID=30732 RepID=A0A3B3BRX0_ORYME
MLVWHHCSVPFCSNNKQKVPYMSFHSFPNDKGLRARWVRAIRRDEGTAFRVLYGSTYVCSHHFCPEEIYTCPSGRKRLKKDAVPSRFSWNNWGRRFIVILFRFFFFI